MSAKERFYITTTLPYVNAEPHLGFALEMVQADVIARYQELLGKEVFFNTGTDEHGLKIYRKAQAEGKGIQVYVDEYAEKFKRLMPTLGISDDIHFIRTTDPHHVAACQDFWRKVDKNGYIEKKFYKVKYCVGCELEKTDSELEDGKCPLHPNLELEIREEENYFFKFSAFQKPLLDLYKRYQDFVVPDFRFNEIKNFVKAGLQDFSISRLKEKMPWGVPVPGDEDHVMYVWFDALINYISTLGWPKEASKFEEFWGTKNNPRAVQIAGKDNLRQQSAMWQAMLLAAGLPSSRQIVIHGFITSGGQKMAKSLGNVADPYEILQKLRDLGLSQEQSIDALRYYLLREIPTFEDGDYTWEHFVETYNANLANGLGNLVSRVLKMVNLAGLEKAKLSLPTFKDVMTGTISAPYRLHMQNYQFQQAHDEIWKLIHACDALIQKKEPFKLMKTDLKKAVVIFHELIVTITIVGQLLKPFLPKTSEQILKLVAEPKLKNIPKLFPRII